MNKMNKTVFENEDNRIKGKKTSKNLKLNAKT